MQDGLNVPNREFRDHDHYQQPHFGLMDIHRPKDSESFRLNLYFIDSSGRPVLGRRWTVHPSRVQPSSAVSMSSRRVANLNAEALCRPISGAVSLWKDLVFRAKVSLFLFFFILLPLLVVAWLLVACLYYVFMGAEMRRRDRLMALSKKRQ